MLCGIMFLHTAMSPSKEVGMSVYYPVWADRQTVALLCMRISFSLIVKKARLRGFGKGEQKEGGVRS
jgi:hypothetical protein